MAERSRTTYDELPYNNNPFTHSHPGRLAAIAMLFGMEPAPVERCRVLELGCAAGGNLMPLAEVFPESQFVGLDLSSRQINDGQTLARKLGLDNLQLLAGDLLEVDERLGRFDYIICHGVYSWVPEVVKDKILAICRDNLAPGGVAYVSYNIFPGWHVGLMIREMLGFHVRPDGPALARVREARAFLDFLVQAVPEREAGYRAVLQEEVDRLRSQSDTYLFHEYLEEVNRPVHFHEFVARAAAHGLQYLAEARIDPMAGIDPGRTGDGSRNWPEDIIEREQYFDLIHCRNFRRTLLCHAAVPMSRPPTADRVASLYFSTLAKPESAQLDCLSSQPEEFYGIETKLRFRTGEAGVKAALASLYEAWPRAISLTELCGMVRARLEQGKGAPAVAEDELRQRLARFLVHSFLSNLIELQTHAPPFVLHVRERPKASPLARVQAQQGEPRVTNRRHRNVDIQPVEQVLLPHLDGMHDHAALRGILEERVQAGMLALDRGGADEPMPERLARTLAAGLRQLAVKCVLVD